MGCGGSTAKDTGVKKQEQKYTESKVTKGSSEAEEKKGKEEKPTDEQNGRKEVEEAAPLPVPVVSTAPSLTREEETTSPKVKEEDTTQKNEPETLQTTEVIKSHSSPPQPSLDTGKAQPDAEQDLVVNRSASGSKVSQSSATLGSTSQAVTSTNSDDEIDSDEQVMKMVIKLKEQAILEARKLGSTDIKIGSTPLRSVGGPVELSPKDLYRIRKWADFTPPFEPIHAPADATEAGRQPRENTLRVNQEILDSIERDKKISSSNVAGSHKESRGRHQGKEAGPTKTPPGQIALGANVDKENSKSNVADMAASPVDTGHRNMTPELQPNSELPSPEYQLQKGTKPSLQLQQQQLPSDSDPQSPLRPSEPTGT
eukprot:TRINITY_DN27288_c0_g1_i1.p1 TRINITY_DN27288_c0_g1~~TRINITY_DN27288_c0_g1_i1.p1  ORF type:complete len:370 (+),score=42.60 TRINITY_DN27288_c0_g1_i1:107-1216(+)